MYLKIKDVTKESLYSTEIKYILLTHFQDDHNFSIEPSQKDLKIAAISYS